MLISITKINKKMNTPNNKPQSVQGYLTGIKLLSSKRKTINKTHNKTTIQAKSFIITPDNDARSVVLNSPKGSRQTNKKGHNKSQIYNNNFDVLMDRADLRNEEEDSRSNTHNLQHRNVIIPKSKNKNSARQSDHSSKDNHSKYSQQMKSHKNYLSKIPVLQNKYQHKEDNNLKINDLPQNKNKASSRNFTIIQQKTPSKINQNPDINQLQINQLLSKLLTVKQSLEQSIGQLKHLLDSTAQYLQTIDNQYIKIKETILGFTSRALDAAFREYKNNLPNWIKYENIELSGMNKLAEINFLLQENDAHRNSLLEGSFSKSINPPPTQETHNKIQESKLFAKEIDNARKQCLSFRPLLREERVKKYEQAVYEMAKF